MSSTKTSLEAWQILLNGLVLLVLLIFLISPLSAIFVYAFSEGHDQYLKYLADAELVRATWLTFLVAFIATAVNLVFGVSAAWLVTRYKFRGRGLLMTIIDLPLSISPVVAGMMLVLVYGSFGLLGGFLENFGFSVIFSVPGIVLATLFVTAPLIAREIIPLMQESGQDDEYAALSLGASGFKTFLYVTLPNIRWGIFYGIIICSARAVGEFGAVSVVSGHISGFTNTLPLHIEILFNEYYFVASFAAASVLALFSLFLIMLKELLKLRSKFSRRRILAR